MNLAFTPRNVGGNTGEDKFEKAKRSNIEQMTPNTVSHFGTETQSVSLVGTASNARLRFSTNKIWKSVIREYMDGPILTNTWATVTPTGGNGATLVRINAIANPTSTPRAVYVEFYAEDQPYFLRHGMFVYQAAKPTPFAAPDGGESGGTDFSDANLEVSPNPTAGTAIVQLDLSEAAQVEIKLLDMLGRPIEVLQRLQMIDSQYFDIDLSSYPNGLYRVVATVNGLPIHKTLLLQH